MHFFILWVNFKYVRLYVQPVHRNFGVFQLEWLACVSAVALKILASPMSAPLCYFFRSGASYVSLQSVELLRSFRRITCACNLPTSVSRGRGGKKRKSVIVSPAAWLPPDPSLTFALHRGEEEPVVKRTELVLERKTLVMGGKVLSTTTTEKEVVDGQVIREETRMRNSAGEWPFPFFEKLKILKRMHCSSVQAHSMTCIVKRFHCPWNQKLLKEKSRWENKR